ncbi:MAG: type II toxin-antitoxin system PemK/MazF family toxin [Deltaproteobacteria bacterium]|nr:type II toxin-antitoxin system PemK/MazF family toxin [Deltaproteobacteria bacterium]
MTKGKVVLVPFPFDDLSATKVRPAVCLTEPIGPHRHVVLAFITSVTPPDPTPTDLALSPGSAGFAETGLRVPSTVRLHRLMTVSTALISREVGCLPGSLLPQVESRIRLLFGLGDG